MIPIIKKIVLKDPTDIMLWYHWITQQNMLLEYLEVNFIISLAKKYIMKTTLLFFFLLLSISIQAQELNYKISRYEETSSSLFICINSTVTPSYIEHFFSDKESNTPEVRKKTIERLVAELQLKDEEYKAQEKAISKIREAEKLTLDTANIRLQKIQLLQERANVQVADTIVSETKIVDPPQTVIPNDTTQVVTKIATETEDPITTIKP
jgi:hypothetical protein